MTWMIAKVASYKSMMNIKLPYKVPEELKMELLEFVKQDNLTFTEHGRRTFGKVIHKFIKFDDIDSPLAIKVKQFGDDLFNKMGMVTTELDGYNGYCLFVVEEGGYIQVHTDQRHRGNMYPHIRINFLLSKPEDGGHPIIAGETYDMQEDDCWFNHASVWPHGATEVTGNKSRVTLSLGKYVDPNEVITYLKTIF